MAAADRFTFDPVVELGVVTVPAARPSLDDIGGAGLQDDTSFPPSKDSRMLYADMGNQWQLQLAGLARMSATARITISFSAGAPFIVHAQTASSLLVAADFTLTDNGTGDTTVAWAAGKLPAVGCDPGITLNRGALTGVLAYEMSLPTATSIRVLTRDDGTAADMRFTVAIY